LANCQLARIEYGPGSTVSGCELPPMVRLTIAQPDGTPGRAAVGVGVAVLVGVGVIVTDVSGVAVCVGVGPTCVTPAQIHQSASACVSPKCGS